LSHTASFVQELVSVSSTVYEIIWETMVEPEKVVDDNMIERMRSACWVAQAGR